MAKPVDVNFLNQLRTYLKSQWMKNGQQQFSKTLEDIAIDLTGQDKEEIKSAFKNKIFRSLKLLENGGSIKIYRGEGSKANKFNYIDDKMIEVLSDTKEECIDIINDYAQKQNTLTQEVINAYQDLSQKLIAARGDVNYYKQAILSLEPCGFGLDNTPMYKVKKGSDLPVIMERLQKEKQTVFVEDIKP